MGRLITALALLLSACTPATWAEHATWTEHATAPTLRTIVVHVDPAFTSAEHAGILEALGQWNRALNGQLVLVTEPRSWEPIEALPEGWAILRVPAGAWLRTCGQATVSGRVAFVRADCPVREVAAHELGHLLGLGEGRGMMAVRLSAGCPSESQARTVAAVWGLDADRMNWCN